MASQWDRLRRLVHQPHQEPEVRAGGEGRERADAHGEEHPFRLRRDRSDRLLDAGDVDPAIARHGLPGRAHQHQACRARLGCGVASLCRDARGVGMGGVDQEADPLFAQIRGQAFGPTEAADTDIARRQDRRAGAAGERRNHCQRRAEARLSRLGQRAALGGAAQDQQPFRGRRGQRCSLCGRR